MSVIHFKTKNAIFFSLLLFLVLGELLNNLSEVLNVLANGFKLVHSKVFALYVVIKVLFFDAFYFAMLLIALRRLVV
jgi:hypothetical protein